MCWNGLNVRMYIVKATKIKAIWTGTSDGFEWHWTGQRVGADPKRRAVDGRCNRFDSKPLYTYIHFIHTHTHKNSIRNLEIPIGVIPHCLAILRTCHSLTERLAELAMRPLSTKRDSMHRLIESTKRVPYRVDDVVRSMHPPLDLRLLEARLAALVLAVGQVALLTQSVSLTQPDKQQHFLDWIDDGLNEMDAHLLVKQIFAKCIWKTYMILYNLSRCYVKLPSNWTNIIAPIAVTLAKVPVFR